MMNSFLVCGYVASALFAISLIPQIAKVTRTRSAGDISVGFLLLYACASMLMLLYANSITAYPLMLNNCANIISSTFLLVLYFCYTESKQMEG